jgi:hypothetical protein
MKVKEVIEHLSKLDPELEVVRLNGVYIDNSDFPTNFGEEITKIYADTICGSWLDDNRKKIELPDSKKCVVIG